MCRWETRSYFVVRLLTEKGEENWPSIEKLKSDHHRGVGGKEGGRIRGGRKDRGFGLSS